MENDAKLGEGDRNVVKIVITYVVNSEIRKIHVVLLFYFFLLKI